MSEKIYWSKAPEWASVRIRNLATPTLMAWAESYTEGVRFLRDDYDGAECRHLAASFWELVSARPTTPSWSGEGLPPVGVVCEANFVGEWKRFEMRYYGEAYVVFKTAFEVQRTRHDFDTCGVKFRHIRTPEQIEADEREAAVDEMHKLYMEGAKHSGGLYALYDAGYRKQ